MARSLLKEFQDFAKPNTGSCLRFCALALVWFGTERHNLYFFRPRLLPLFKYPKDFFKNLNMGAACCKFGAEEPRGKEAIGQNFVLSFQKPTWKSEAPVTLEELEVQASIDFPVLLSAACWTRPLSLVLPIGRAHALLALAAPRPSAFLL
jgi:hypothetical protein